ncbi:MAG: carotenoid biosynthesis protein [Bacteroidales bacterium]|nr:carotenoid biosynthesis protein [Bacteroidales bacterium]
MLQYLKFSKIVLIVGYLVGIVGILISLDKPHYFTVAWYFVVLSFGLLMLFHKPHSIKFWITLTVIGVLGFVVEAIGTNTGVIFGNYTYGKSLGIKLFQTPLVMAVNWMVLVYLVYDLLKGWNINFMLKSFLSSIILVVYDFVMEPVAIKLDMWTWEAGNPPLHNYIGWFVVSLLFFVYIYRSKLRFDNPLSRTLFLLQGVFFGALNVLFRLIE